MPDFEIDTWKLRLTATADSQRRSRYVFAILTIVSVGIAIIGFNMSFAWERTYVTSIIKGEQLASSQQQLNDLLVKEKASSGQAGAIKLPDVADRKKQLSNTIEAIVSPRSSPPRVSRVDLKTRIPFEEMQRTVVQQQLREWVGSLQYHIPLLGIVIGMSDLPLLGSVSLLVICVWFYYCCRRENHAVHQLLKDAMRVAGPSRNPEGPSSLAAFVFHGIASYLVFTTLSESEAVYHTVKDSPTARPSHPRALFQAAHRTTMQFLLRILFYLPPAAIVFVAVCDLYTLWEPAVFRPVSAGTTLWQAMPSTQRWHLVIEYFPTVVFVVLTTYICNVAVQFNNGTRQMLREFWTYYVDNSADLSVS